MGHPFQHVKSNKAGHKRVAHILASHSGAKMPAKKARGGSCNSTSAPMSKAAAYDDGKPEMHSEGARGKHRMKAGGKVKPHVGSINIVHVHPMHHGLGPQDAPGMMAAPPPGAVDGPPPGAMDLGPGLPPPGAMPGAPGGLPMRNQGGRTGSYGSGTGMSRKAEFERIRREGH
jgi:hypothetical protein